LFGERLKLPVVCKPANPHKVLREGEILAAKGIGGEAGERGGRGRADKTAIPESIAYVLDNFVYKDVKLEGEEDKNSQTSDRQYGERIILREEEFYDDADGDDLFDRGGEQMDYMSCSSSLPSDNENILWDGDRERARKGTAGMSVVSSTLAVFKDNSIEALKRRIKMDYSPRLTKYLARHCYVAPRVEVSDNIPTRGPMVDLGLLAFGNEITIKLKVTNNSGDKMVIDTSARNFESDDTRILANAKPMATGMTKEIIVNFTVQTLGKKSIISFVDVYAISSRNGINCCIQCPVHYRVDPGTRKDHLPRCTMGSLNHLLRKFCYEDGNLSEQKGLSLQHLSFEKKKVYGDSWDTLHMKSKSLNASLRDKTINYSYKLEL
jgi:hypothetical protein